jgi:hypothetical protein
MVSLTRRKPTQTFRISLAGRSSAFSRRSRFSSATPHCSRRGVGRCRPRPGAPTYAVSRSCRCRASGDRGDRRPVGVVVRPHLGDHPHRTLTQLGRVPEGRDMTRSSTSGRAGIKPGAVQVHRTGITVRLPRGHLLRRLQRRDRPVSPPRHEDTGSLDLSPGQPRRLISEATHGETCAATSRMHGSGGRPAETG